MKCAEFLWYSKIECKKNNIYCVYVFGQKSFYTSFTIPQLFVFSKIKFMPWIIFIEAKTLLFSVLIGSDWRGEKGMMMKAYLQTSCLCLVKATAKFKNQWETFLDLSHPLFLSSNLYCYSFLEQRQSFVLCTMRWWYERMKRKQSPHLLCYI